MKVRALALTTGLALALGACGTQVAFTPTVLPSVSVGSSSDPTPSITPSLGMTCSFSSGSAAMIPDVQSLTWASYAIVTGIITQRFPSVPNPQAPQQPLYTEFEVKVEQTFRGIPANTLRLRQGGGSIPGGCTDFQGEPHLEVGERFLLFLYFPRPGVNVPTYLVTGGLQGYWQLDANDRIIRVAPHYQQFNGGSLDAVTSRIATALAGPQPALSIAGGIPVVPLDQAPAGSSLPKVAPQATP